MTYVSVAIVVAVAVTLAGIAWDYNGLRGGALPWGSAGLGAAVSFVAWEYRLRALGRPRRLLVAGSVLVQAVLVSMAAFLLAVALGNVVGSRALRDTDGGLATLATLLGSVEVMIVLPIGLLLLAIATALDRRTSRAAPVLAATAVVTYVAGPVLVGLLPDSTERVVMSAWLVLVAATWIAIAGNLGRLPVGSTA
jgi:hypothetical protein